MNKKVGIEESQELTNHDPIEHTRNRKNVMLLTESESGYISSSHIRLIRCLAVIGQASFTREHLV